MSVEQAYGGGTMLGHKTVPPHRANGRGLTPPIGAMQ